MKERPILFSGPMVRAIIDGRKTQTRRLVKPQPVSHDKAEPGNVVFYGGVLHRVVESRGRNKRAMGLLNATDLLCPFGVPGDRLWVREAWKFFDWTEDGEPCIEYAADGSREWPTVPEEHGDRVADIWSTLSHHKNFGVDNRAADRRWRPSIHMPRWASRLTLEVVSVRVERLQEISEADCAAEGIFPDFNGTPISGLRHEYAALWDSINGKGAWAADPWVWVVEFRRITT